jgi:hypothetical protein
VKYKDMAIAACLAVGLNGVACAHATEVDRPEITTSGANNVQPRTHMTVADDANSAESHGGHAHGVKTPAGTGCQIALQITEEAERRLGGASFEGAAPQEHSSHGQAMPEMEGAHMIHKPQYGGAFFMAPNKTHHLEAIYSDECGFRLVFYNAFTEPIRADRFRALISAIPENQEEFEVLRFLSLSEDKTVLAATIGDRVSRPFEIELYVEFPGTDELELFNIQVPATMH